MWEKMWDGGAGLLRLLRRSDPCQKHQTLLRLPQLSHLLVRPASCFK